MKHVSGANDTPSTPWWGMGGRASTSVAPLTSWWAKGATNACISFGTKAKGINVSIAGRVAPVQSRLMCLPSRKHPHGHLRDGKQETKLLC